MPSSSSTSAGSAARARARRSADGTFAQWCVGVIEDAAPGGELQVRSGGLQLRAHRAASCLLEPAAGDSVACLRCAPQEAWVLAVLQRDEGSVHVLRAAAGAAELRIESGDAPLALQGSQIVLTGQRLEARVEQARMVADQAELLGRQLSVVAGSIKAVGQFLSTVMDRVQHFSHSHTRTTEGIDRVAATHVEVAADALLRMDAEHALVNGRSLVKARGAQIHFG